MSILKDITKLKEVSIPVASVEEATGIINNLEKELNESKNGIGLAACQIGIFKTVGLIKAGSKKYTLINPEIVEISDEFIYLHEGCLSIPNKYIDTKRYRCVTIDNHVIDNNEFRKERQYFEYLRETPAESPDNMITVAVQHEIDHFNGILMTDHEIISVPLVNMQKKIGRNEPCPCGSGKKFKKCCGK